MTTTDARKRNRDARDAAWMLAALDGTGEPRTRTHAINPETGEFTPLDFHREWLHVMDTQRPHTPQENDMPNNQRRHREQMGVLDQIHDTLTEIRDRLPEREVACGDVWRDETERPCTRPSGHDGNHVDKAGTIWANPDPADITEEPPVGSQVTDMGGEVWERREGGWALWWPERSGWIADLYEGELDPWPAARNHAPLRPTTDEDRKRVGLPVEPAPEGIALIETLFDPIDYDGGLPGDAVHARNVARSLLNPPTEGEAP